MPGRRRPSNRYELFTCAWSGHVLVGTDAAIVTSDDALVVREDGPLRWHRCLRCDCWVPQAAPDQPARERVEQRDEIRLPLRGAALRDRYVLRLIAVDRAIHVVVLTALAVALLTFAAHDQALHHDYQNIMNDLAGGTPGASQARGLLGYFGRAFKYSPTHLRILALVLLAFAALEAAEMVGLWLNKRWAEYLTFIATTALGALRGLRAHERRERVQAHRPDHQPRRRHLPAPGQAALRPPRRAPGRARPARAFERLGRH